MTSLGPSALMRTGGFPVRLWLAAGSPDLFHLLGSLDSLHEEYRQLGRALAARIGTELVPRSTLSVPDRRLALDLRRRFHNGAPVTASACRHLAGLTTARTNPAGITRELERAAHLSAEISSLEQQAIDAIAREQRRILLAPWVLLHASPSGQQALSDGSLAVAEDVRRRLADGDSWSSKRMRRRSDQLWQVITRGATTATPRSWFGHVTLVAVDDHGSDAPLRLSVTGEFASEWIENVHTERRELVEHTHDRVDGDTYVAFTPLHRSEGEHVTVWAIDPRSPDQVTPLQVRHTPLLTALHASLRQGARPLHQLEADVLPARCTAHQRQVLRSFVAHLAELGVLQLSHPPRRRHTGWQELRPASPHTAATDADLPPSVVTGNHDGAGFLDVYRRAAGAIPLTDCVDLQRSINQARRLYALIEADGAATDDPLLGLVEASPRPVLDVFAEWLGAMKSSDETDTRTDWNVSWPRAHTPGSGYRRLLDRLATCPDRAAPFDIPSDLFDALGAPQQALAWPLDCLVRPLASRVGAVLESVAPAGVLDARFVGALQRLHHRMPHVAAYRTFLEGIERYTKTPLVEILVPPLSDIAANAVRRPLYTRMWTGDPDLHMYCEPTEPAPEFVPLKSLTVRHNGNGIVVEADGRPIRPVYHATRMPPPPWDTLVRLLLHGSPQRTCWDPRIKHTLGALPERTFAPRITVGGTLVLAAAQWRVRPEQLWDPAASDLEKARMLRRLRDTLDLPRWVLLARKPGEDSQPCDLGSLRAVRLLEHNAAETDTAVGMVLEEMVPAPDEFPVTDPADISDDRVAAEMMLRLPCDESPQAMAARLAADRPDAPRERCRPPCRHDGGADADAHCDSRRGGETDGDSPGQPRAYGGSRDRVR